MSFLKNMKLDISKNIFKIFTPKRKNLKRYLYLIGALLFIYAYIVGDYGIYQLLLKKNEERKLKGEIELLKLDYEKLQREKETVNKGDLDEIERIAREKYNMAKPGEKVFHIIINEKF